MFENMELSENMEMFENLEMLEKFGNIEKRIFTELLISVSFPRSASSNIDN
jgi:hypothetical protein